MVYIMEFYVDGGCRGNGQPGAIGAAAAIHVKRGGKYETRTYTLPSSPTPTNQRAEIRAIILALRWALKKYDELNTYPRLSVRIHSDSRYAVNCMNEWIYKWCQNGWVNSSGYQVANRDLIQKASDLDDRVKELGSVSYIWVPRYENVEADEACNQVLDDQERDNEDSEYSDDWYCY